MAKYIIDIPEEAMMYVNIWKYEDGKCVWADSYLASDLKPYTASESYIDGLKKGQNDAWDFATSCIDMDGNDFYRCFEKDNIYYLTECTYSEAKIKYEKWKKKKEEIHVGDEIIPLDTQYDTMIVTKLWANEYCDEWVDAIASDGKLFSFLKTSIKKTGRHFNEVEDLLKKIKG